MKKVILSFIAAGLMSTACQPQRPAPPSEETIEAAVQAAWADLYQHYEQGDLAGFAKHYEDSVIRMGTGGSTQVGKEVFVNSWEETYAHYRTVVEDYSQPTILAGPEQSLTYNTYRELFIHREKGDTNVVAGTWVGLWRKQADGSWKLRMSTWHNH